MIFCLEQRVVRCIASRANALLFLFTCRGGRRRANTSSNPTFLTHSCLCEEHHEPLTPCARNLTEPTRDGENINEYSALLIEASQRRDQAGEEATNRCSRRE